MSSDPPTLAPAPPPEPSAAGRRPYVRPVLEVLGDVRDLTLGPSIGIGDSVSPATHKPPGT